MASSETEIPEPNSRNTPDLSALLPIIFRLMTRLNNTHPDQNPPENPDPYNQNRFFFVNPITQSVVVIEGGSFPGLDSLFRDLMSKEGQPPASKASIEAMPEVEVKKGEECSICLEEFEGLGKEMPCKHKFHGGCVDKWLKIHGSCPVCRYKMPADDDGDFGKKTGEEEGGGRRRTTEIWVSFSRGDSERASGDVDQMDDDDDVVEDSGDFDESIGVME